MSDMHLWFAGQTLYAELPCEGDVRTLLPDSLTLVQPPDQVVLKSYILKRLGRGEHQADADSGTDTAADDSALAMRSTPDNEVYQQVCLSLLTRCGDDGPRQHNLVMYEDRDWAALAGSAFGWPKRMARIDQTWLFSGASSEQRGPTEYDVDLCRSDREILRFRGDLDGGSSEIEAASVSSFHTISRPASAPRVCVTRTDNYFAELVTSGSGVFRIAPGTGEDVDPSGVLNLLPEAGTARCALYRVGWTRAGGDVEPLDPGLSTGESVRSAG